MGDSLKTKLDNHFKDWSPETDVIVVGSSPSIKWYEFGPYIDKFKTVIRVNKCFHPDIVEHTGKKISIWATTNNDRWGKFSPIIKSQTKEVWGRQVKTIFELAQNNSLKKFDGHTMMSLRAYNDGFHFKGIGTGLLAIRTAIDKYPKITIVGHTFYLEGGEDNRALNFYSEEEDEEHAQNRMEYFNGDKHRLRQMSYVKEWMGQGKITLLNPFEYDNLRTEKNEVYGIHNSQTK